MFKHHPRGLAPLFFIEMWERLSFYVIGGILLLYALDTERGGLGLPNLTANDIVGTYLAFVYATPFLGGLIADRYLGFRRSVLIGGLCMAAGLFSLGTRGETFFVLGLVLVCIGNGFFKPNISAMVGNLYERGDPRRDAGFNLFYMGINIGAFAAFFSSAWVRDQFGWFWAFRMAGCGLLIGVLLLLVFWRLLAKADKPSQKRDDDIPISTILLTILVPALVVGFVGWWVATTWFPDSPVTPPMCGFLAGMLPLIVFFLRLPAKTEPQERAGLLALLPIFVAGGTFFMILHLNTTALTQWANQDTDRHSASVFDLAPWNTTQDALPSYFRNAAADVPRPSKDTLVVVDEATALKFGTSRLDVAAVAAVRQQHPDVAAVSTSGEVAGATPSTDPEIARRAANVYPDGAVTVQQGRDSHGVPTIAVDVAEGSKAAGRVAFTRQIAGAAVPVLLVSQATFDDVYRLADATTPTLPPGDYLRVTSAELFQAANAGCVILFTPLLVWFWGFLRRRSRDVSTADKIYYGLLLTMVSMLVMALAGWLTEGGTLKVSALWLLTAYAIVTVGELCLSPMGLSLVTKLSPKRFVGLMMGGWFCATAFGNKLSGFFGGIQALMSPTTFFLVLAATVAVVALAIRAILPWLDRTIRQYGA
ncbi:MAG: peptide MFS transporter [Planctomycetes bacterium]|nr:peptide MFS transporter [Planctomycetota bacterium]